MPIITAKRACHTVPYPEKQITPNENNLGPIALNEAEKDAATRERDKINLVMPMTIILQQKRFELIC